MTRLNYTYPSSAFVGFERLFDELNKAHSYTGHTSTYPPHNIIKTSDSTYDIELAVAGIDPEKIEIITKENTLSISYIPENKKDVEYVHKGISEKRFKKEFTLQEHIIVDGASADNGVLTVHLRLEIPEEKKPRKIEISGKPQLLNE